MLHLDVFFFYKLVPLKSKAREEVFLFVPDQERGSLAVTAQCFMEWEPLTVHKNLISSPTCKQWIRTLGPNLRGTKKKTKKTKMQWINGQNVILPQPSTNISLEPRSILTAAWHHCGQNPRLTINMASWFLSPFQILSSVAMMLQRSKHIYSRVFSILTVF